MRIMTRRQNPSNVLTPYDMSQSVPIVPSVGVQYRIKIRVTTESHSVSSLHVLAKRNLESFRMFPSRNLCLTKTTISRFWKNQN